MSSPRAVRGWGRAASAQDAIYAAAIRPGGTVGAAVGRFGIVYFHPMRHLTWSVLAMLGACKPSPPTEERAREGVLAKTALLDSIEKIATTTPDEKELRTKLATEIAGQGVLGVRVDGFKGLPSCCGGGLNPLIDPPAAPNVGKYRVGRGNYSTAWEAPPCKSEQQDNHPGAWVRWTAGTTQIEVGLVLDDWKRPAAWDACLLRR